MSVRSRRTVVNTAQALDLLNEQVSHLAWRCARDRFSPHEDSGTHPERLRLLMEYVAAEARQVAVLVNDEPAPEAGYADSVPSEIAEMISVFEDYHIRSPGYEPIVHTYKDVVTAVGNAADELINLGGLTEYTVSMLRVINQHIGWTSID